MPTYSQRLKAHLARYKVERLGVIDSGTYEYRGRRVAHGHILPPSLRWLNIHEQYRKEVKEFASHSIKLHRHFHHLNSSQAFVLNLFYPFFEAHRESSFHLTEALGQKGRVAKWNPEHIPDVREGTNVDVAWTDERGVSTFCEVKLSEAEFGAAEGHDRHKRKLLETYLPILAECCNPELTEERRFFANYQILRNIWVIARNERDTLVFLLPRSNVRLGERLAVTLSAIHRSIRKRIQVTYIEDVLSALHADRTLNPQLTIQTSQLAEKYLIS